jgi:type IV pilus assembly protein PilE
MKSGFSLIELIIILSIIGILSLISYPVYKEHLIRVHRVCAIVALADASGEMEKYRLLHNTYEGVKVENLSITTIRCNYCYKFDVKLDNSSYTLEAVPIGKQKNDIACGVLTIDQNGNKKASGGGGAKCWV